MAAGITQKDLHYLGKLYLNHYPETARELLRQRPCVCFDGIINHYDTFKAFSTHEPLTGRRVFIACMLHIFLPNAFTQPSSVFKPETGFSSRLNQCLNMDIGHLSKMIRMVVVEYRAYDDFKALVGEALIRLKGEAE